MVAAIGLRPTSALLAAALVSLPMLAAAAPPPAAETPFLTENKAAMDKMMAGMDVKPTGDIDKDFVAMMSAHHQGAIDMAKTLLRYGKNERLRRLAQEIIVDQTEEIAAMHLAVGEPAPASAPVPTQIPAVPVATPHHSPER